MAFNSLNTIDKDCVTVASSGRKMSVWPPLVLTRKGNGKTVHSQGQREMQKWGYLDFFSARECCQSVPVLLVSLFFGYECWGYHLHLGENCVLCFPGILFRGTLVLSFNQENRLVVFLLLNFYSLFSKYR